VARRRSEGERAAARIEPVEQRPLTERAREQQMAAFGAERAAWAAAGEFDARPEPSAARSDGGSAAFDVPPGATVVQAPLSASIWKVEAGAGDEVVSGSALVVVAERARA
jgi:urea carboxylase